MNRGCWLGVCKSKTCDAKTTLQILHTNQILLLSQNAATSCIALNAHTCVMCIQCVVYSSLIFKVIRSIPIPTFEAGIGLPEIVKRAHYSNGSKYLLLTGVS